MKQIARLISIVLGFGLLAAVLSTINSSPVQADKISPVQVVNTPLPVQDAEHPARQRFAVRVCVPFGDDATQKCQALGESASFQAPAGKVLVLEQVSGSCGMSTGITLLDVLLSAQTNGSNLDHTFPMKYPVPPGGSNPIGVVFENTRIYADAGSMVSLQNGSAIGPGSPGEFPQFVCRLTLSGHLVNP